MEKQAYFQTIASRTLGHLLAGTVTLPHYAKRAQYGERRAELLSWGSRYVHREKRISGQHTPSESDAQYTHRMAIRRTYEQAQEVERVRIWRANIDREKYLAETQTKREERTLNLGHTLVTDTPAFETVASAGELVSQPMTRNGRALPLRAQAPDLRLRQHRKELLRKRVLAEKRRELEQDLREYWDIPSATPLPHTLEELLALHISATPLSQLETTPETLPAIQGKESADDTLTTLGHFAVRYRSMVSQANHYVVMSSRIPLDQWRLETSAPTLKGAEFKAGMLHKAHKERQYVVLPGSELASFAQAHKLDV